MAELAFIAPLGVAAMVDASNRAWLDALWEYVVAQKVSSSAYFGNTIKMLTMITMSGKLVAALSIPSEGDLRGLLRSDLHSSREGCLPREAVVASRPTRGRYPLGAGGRACRRLSRRST